MAMTVDELRVALNRLGDGVLYKGKHEPDHRMCLLEFDQRVRGKPWSDEPGDLPDLRWLNDAPGWATNQARTDALLPVHAAYWDWANLVPERQQQIMVRVVLGIVQQLVAALPGLLGGLRRQCCAVTTITEAAEATEAVEWWAAAAAAEAEAEAEAEVVMKAALEAKLAVVRNVQEAALAMAAAAWAVRVVGQRHIMLAIHGARTRDQYRRWFSRQLFSSMEASEGGPIEVATERVVKAAVMVAETDATIGDAGLRRLCDILVQAV